MEAFRTEDGVVLVVMDREEAESLVGVLRDEVSALDSALSAGQGAEAEGEAITRLSEWVRVLGRVVTG